ncbi:MAG TPA: hypothetical protein VEB64_03360 [Azospirillaceae bacterium]|nr:hypothetical protein [Azospirillaceae bacterium]
MIYLQSRRAARQPHPIAEEADTDRYSPAARGWILLGAAGTSWLLLFALAYGSWSTILRLVP